MPRTSPYRKRRPGSSSTPPRPAEGGRAPATRVVITSVHLLVTIYCDRSRTLGIIYMSMNVGWRRIASLLILLWAVVDMSVPSLCQADSGFFPVPQQQSTTVSVDQNRDSQPASPSNEDDCFCCCSHVSPTPHFELSTIASRQEGVAPDPAIHLREYAEPHYHPPRA